MRYLLLGTAGCHLCEQAQEIVRDCGLSVEVIDIAEQEHWQARYAVRIPVLIEVDTLQELAWSFTHADVQFFEKSLQKLIPS